MLVCGFNSQYDQDSSSCISCQADYFSFGLQAATCTSCKDSYSSLRDPTEKTFQSALYSQACKGYILSWEGNASLCENGVNEDGSCKEKAEVCENGKNPDGSCKAGEIICDYGAELDGTCKEKPKSGSSKKASNTWWIVLLIIVILLIIALIIFCVIYKKKKEEDRKKAYKEKEKANVKENTPRANKKGVS
jgi:hypothetical protein